MRSIQVLGKKVTGWQVLPVDAPDFEQAAPRAGELVVAKDPRIGKALHGAPLLWRPGKTQRNARASGGIA